MAKRTSSSASPSQNSKKSKNVNNQLIQEPSLPIENEMSEDLVVVDSTDEAEEEVEEGDEEHSDEAEEEAEEGDEEHSAPQPRPRKKMMGPPVLEEDCCFTSSPVPDLEAKRRWPHRYVDEKTNKKAGLQKIASSNDDEQEPMLARCHYTQAKIDGQIFNLYDDAYVAADIDEDDYICKIVELFETKDGSQHFTAQWFYRAKDTVIGEPCGKELIDEKCIFFSEVKDDNPLNCLVKKLNIVKISSKADSDYIKNVKDTCDYYCQMMYLLSYTSFVNLPDEELTQGNESNLTVSADSDLSVERSEASSLGGKADLVLLDLYSGCGGMSTGLCLGGSRGGVRVTTKWAVDFNEHACNSLRLNHPETQVRNEPAENFLSLLKEWHQLCASYSLVGDGSLNQHGGLGLNGDGDVTGGEDNEVEEEEDDNSDVGEVYEVEEILDICYGDPKESNEIGLHFKIKWKDYGPEYDTWEPLECLSGCPEKLKEFVVHGFKSKLLPLPGDVDVICGGPPCQGISGFNRFRNAEEPLKDEKNKQLLVYMDIVSFLKPKYVLMENVVDILKFSEGFLGKYAIGKMVQMGYQARMGMMAAGAYGLPQFRMRFFLWGALSTETLPGYALPTHKVVSRGVVPKKFESSVVTYDKGDAVVLKNELFLEDALSDLPAVENDESRDIMPYNGDPQTDFQRFIRLKKEVMEGSTATNLELHEDLYDHRPLELNTDDYQRVCRIPVRKGANFRHLPGVILGPDKKVAFDPAVPREYLPSKKPLVPDYAMTFVGGTSSKPFGRLWWDETVPTVVTRAEPHNQCILHPTQSRVLTIRENARLQGFPDYYQLTGPIKQRYMQVGNAVAVPVARALGYCLALAFKGDVGNQPLVELPRNFSEIQEPVAAAESS